MINLLLKFSDASMGPFQSKYCIPASKEPVKDDSQYYICVQVKVPSVWYILIVCPRQADFRNLYYIYGFNCDSNTPVYRKNDCQSVMGEPEAKRSKYLISHSSNNKSIKTVIAFFLLFFSRNCSHIEMLCRNKFISLTVINLHKCTNGVK